MKKIEDFKITVSLKDKELLIIDEKGRDIKFFVETEKDVLRCIKNYIEVYFKKTK